MPQDIELIINRLKKAVENSQFSYVELEKITGIPKSTIQRYANGKTKKIPVDAIQSIAKAVNVSDAYIMGWSDEPIIPQADNIIPLPKTKMVPLVGTIACGEPILANENVEEMVPMPEHINADFALRCKGDSMINARILDNDIVYIRQQETVENGEIAAVLIDNEATLKRFYRYGDTVVLRAENPNYKEFEYKKEQLNEIKVLGKAVHFLSVVQ